MKPETVIRSMVMRALASRWRRSLLHTSGGLRRRLQGGEPSVHYFHQVDDPYSHLAAQALPLLQERYRVHFAPHLAPEQGAAFAGDLERYPQWALADAADVAPFYGLSFPNNAALPGADAVLAANQALAQQLASEGFAQAAVKVGDALWRGVAQAGEGACAETVRKALRQGGELRRRLGHYRGGMLHFEGEWYWGVDRLCRLEERLAAAGFSRVPDAPLCVPRPKAEEAAGLLQAKGASLNSGVPGAVNAGSASVRSPAEESTPPSAKASNKGALEAVTLEFYVSLRSPYTAISFRRTLDLAAGLGVNLALKPVLPMVMRGVPGPAAKGIYIMNDARREADAAGVRFGRIVDPLGEPVRQAFSLYPWARESGRAAAYLQSYLDAAFADGIDIGSRRGLRRVVERAGLPWREAAARLGEDSWQQELERNLADMHAVGLWGVPSYSVSGGAKPGRFSCWGQDRLWRVEAEIAARTAPLA